MTNGARYITFTASLFRKRVLFVYEHKSRGFGMRQSVLQRKFAFGAAFAGILTLLGACAESPDVPTAESADPLEGVNRAVHGFNKGIDRVAIKPASDVYVAVLPKRARGGVSNVAANLLQPVYAANHLLQGDVEDAGTTVMRFGFNTFFGLGGLLDPASEAGMFDNPTDFGETMAVWGVGSGPYVELPIFGPSTVRDSLGLAVDIYADPVPRALGDDAWPYVVGIRVADVLQERNELARVIEALYYESADSYSATRIAYLQNRAKTINEGALALEDLEDPYDF